MGFLLAQWTGWKWQKFKCFRCPKFSSCHCKSKLPEHVRLSIQMPTLNIFELRQRFRKSVEYFWRYRIFAATVYSVQVESGKNSNVVDAQSFHLAITKVKHLRTWNFPPKCPPSTSSSSGKDFEDHLNTFGDIGFLLPKCTSWKWQNFKCCRCAKFSSCHCKNKIPPHLKLSTQMPTLSIFERRQRFRISIENFWRYGIFAGTVNRLKVAKFQMFSMRKIFTLPLQK